MTDRQTDCGIAGSKYYKRKYFFFLELFHNQTEYVEADRSCDQRHRQLYKLVVVAVYN